MSDESLCPSDGQPCSLDCYRGAPARPCDPQRVPAALPDLKPASASTGTRCGACLDIDDCNFHNSCLNKDTMTDIRTGKFINYDNILPRVSARLAQGAQQQEIADELEVSGFVVSKAVKMIRGDGATRDELPQEVAFEFVPQPEPEAPVEAIASTLAERKLRYGSFSEQAVIAENLNVAMTDAPGWTRLAPDQKEALRIIQNKVARILNGDPDYSDSWHDIVGYAKLVDDRLKGEGK